MSNADNTSKISSREHSPPTQLVNLKSLNAPNSENKIVDDELKLDIHIFSMISDKEKNNASLKESNPNRCSVEIQTESPNSSLKMRNVSTQHRTPPLQKLPRSFGTLTVTPWSGATSDAVVKENKKESDIRGKEKKKNLKGVYTLPFSNI